MIPKFIESQQLLEALRWRYATKVFDPAKRIPGAQWKALEEALILSPSSYGLQPWKFRVVADGPTREKLMEVSWKQRQVVDASHFVVFTSKTDVTAADIGHWTDRLAEVQGLGGDSLNRYRDMMISDLVNGPRHAVIGTWASRQTYIALGNFMTSAALLGIDTCPLEGLDPAKYDEILGIRGTGYTTLCACAAGYRSAQDKYASMPKVRYPRSEMIETV